MSAFSRYAADSEIVSAIHARDRTRNLAAAYSDVHALDPDAPALNAFPISGDMLAVVKRGTHAQRKRRRKRAAARRAAI